jgi:hypothetical protein
LFDSLKFPAGWAGYTGLHYSGLTKLQLLPGVIYVTEKEALESQTVFEFKYVISTFIL